MSKNKPITDIINLDSSKRQKVDSLLNRSKKGEVVPDIEDLLLNKSILPDDTVMVVDDDSSQLFSIEKVLKNDFQLVLCDRGKAAIEKFEEEKFRIKAVLLDIRLPDMDGFEVFLKLKKINEQIPIVFITGYQGTYGDGFEIYKKYRPHGYIIKNHENEMVMIKDTLKNAVDSYNRMLENLKNEQMKVRNQTIAGLLHDLKNMFTPVLMLPDMIKMLYEMEKHDKVKELIDKMKNSVDLFSANQHILFNYAKGEKMRVQFETYSFTELMNGFFDMIKGQIPESIRFEANLYYDGDIVTDKNILCCQVILNIIKNAREAMGSIEDPCIIFDAYPYGKYLLKYKEESQFSGRESGDIVIVISDNGPGIPKEIENSIFDAYVTYGKKGGSGLGTWMIKNGVEGLLKGKVSLVNNPGKGVSYHIYLPQKKLIIL